MSELQIFRWSILFAELRDNWVFKLKVLAAEYLSEQLRVREALQAAPLTFTLESPPQPVIARAG